MAVLQVLAGTSSVAIRLLAFVFLRWIPGHPFPGQIISAFAVYVTSIVLQSSRAPLRRGPSNTAPQKSASPTGHDNGLPPQHNRQYQAQWLPTPLRVVMTGVPDWSCTLASISSILLNALLVIMVADLTFTPHLFFPKHDLSFARVGHTSATTAALLTREPLAERYPIDVHIRKATNSPGELTEAPWHLVASIPAADSTTDFTSSWVLQNLSSDTKYDYMLTNGINGTFRTSLAAGQISTQQQPFTFVHSSCIVPGFPYLPLRNPLAMSGFKLLAQKLPELQARFMLFLGDFIYIDVPRRFGTDKESYRRKYRHVYASPDWPAVSSELPWLHVYDDHEIANDWDRNETGVYPSAVDPYLHYQASVNPPAVRTGATYYSFRQGPASFFMLDTRRYRTPFDGTDGRTNSMKSMLGRWQREDLLAWLSEEEPAGVHWKIVISSIPFTKNWRFGWEDTWAGYLGERQVILRAMWDAASAVNNAQVVVLSGDRHEFAATAFPPPSTGQEAGKWPLSATVHEFSASPLSMFYLPVRTYKQKDDEDVCVQYLPDGNSKFGAVKILGDASNAETSILVYELYIDGKLAWNHSLTRNALHRREQ